MASEIITVLAAAFALLLVISVPALAHHKDGHDKSGSTSSKDSGATSSSTEPDDNDDNRHPSGKDRETNNGPTDDTQGKSGSTPDQNGKGPERDYEGTDKPGGAGGMDKEDQDGNNGCGNDDDFEDDNEGWCGNKPKKDNDVKPADDGDDIDDEVQGGVIEVPSLPDSDVLGLRVRGERGVAVAPAVRGQQVRGGALPFTGGDVLGFIFLALGLVAAGYLMLRSKRSV